MLLKDNEQYFKYTELNISSINELFFNPLNTKRLLTHLDKYKDQLVRLYKWIKKNPISPQYSNNKDVVLYKRRQPNNQNISQSEILQSKK